MCSIYHKKQRDRFKYQENLFFLSSQRRDKAECTIATQSESSLSREFKAGIDPLLCLSKLRPLLPVLATPSVYTAPKVGITCDNLTGGLGPELNGSPRKKDTRSSVTGSPAKLNDSSKSSLNSRASIYIDAEKSLSLSSATSSQASTSGANL
ncbi:hypothetical protein AYI68_g440 [Smittium mucronatum]|uniref:Uncharacterized protein n=1 Tax=Smittium mucronatum TaxID=133383 RepID=A0A1R0H834_9FUNG|nr:hypothetical protein AYI68_g440 [Smittium mucronatum]